MVDLFDEIDEELKQERIVRLLNKYLTHIMVFITAGAIVATSLTIWNKRRANQQEQLGNIYSEAVLADDSGNIQAALIGLDQVIARQHAGGLTALALFKKAFILRREGKLEEALLLYDNISSDTANDIAMRELAGLVSLAHLTEKNPNDQTIKQRFDQIKKIAGPFHQMVNLTEAMWFLRRNDNKSGLTILKAINEDSKTPHFLRQEVAAVITILSELDNNPNLR